jgi:cytoskeleton protein RodZ
MSKRKRKNKSRFNPQGTPTVAPMDKQTQLLLATVDEHVGTELQGETMIPETVDEVPVEALESASEPAVPAVEVPLAISTQANELPVLDESLGQRLRAAREARGLSREEAAQALKLPASVLAALETEQFDRIGHGVYLRGYLSKYLQLLDLPMILADRVLRDHETPPPLTTNVSMSHSRYLFERYSGSALYLILTAVIVVPAVLLAWRIGLERKQVHITPLDTPAVLPAPVAPAPERTAAPVASEAAVTDSAPAQVDTERPYIASMAPFPAAADTPLPAPPPTAAAKNHLHLTLTDASWVEVRDASGKQLEFSLLPAGSERDYASDKALDVRFGNAGGVELRLGGKVLDLAAFKRANVAHFKVLDGAATAVRSND